ncbi:dihydrorhizobitoxine desaturase [Leptolyngbya sp. Heron Island J]|uniref:fatty acid desaturase n=1 Tax=Leptolyngbya sp. Heron Island J TaxID=1385935 RepID=UPI0003B95F98|nr:fatty acid desaturase [Leptolyngbya sp. Heron Island J]ESA36551.1 dihydrorhizobitoxine desaturase [Leptolyngbya sp. Heron Island J]
MSLLPFWALSCLFLITVSIVIRLTDILFHPIPSSLDHKLISESKLDFDEIKEIVKSYSLGPHRIDDFLAPFLFVSVYVNLLAMGVFVWNTFNYWYLHLPILILSAGKFRNLQEITHYAVHGSLCTNKKFGRFLADLFFQLPACQSDAKTRTYSHLVLHHPNANVFGKDPNLDDFIKVGLTAGISNLQFWYCIFYPISLNGIKDTIYKMLSNIFCQNNYYRKIRISIVLIVAFAFFLNAKLAYCLAVVYLIPLIVFYPLFAWWSQVIEHRWYVKNIPVSMEFSRLECEVGRPTIFSGFEGWIIKNEVLPFCDSYHLAHSLLPFVRWNFLPFLDKALRFNLPYYSKYESFGLFFSSLSNKSSAIFQLKDRLVSE